MEKTFETPGGVDLHVENQVGLVVVTARATDTTIVSLEADTPGARSSSSGPPSSAGGGGPPRGGREDPAPARHALPAPQRGHGARRGARGRPGGRGHGVGRHRDQRVVGEVDVKTASGDASADDVAADVKATTASGNITMGTVGGDIKAQTASGDLRCSSVAGATVFSTVSGDLEVGAAGSRVEAKATSGNVRLGEVARGAKVANVSGNVRVLTLSEGALHVRSVSGDVAVGVAKGVDLHVDVETASGIVHSEIALDDAPAPGRRPETRVDLSVRSVSGNVEIGRALDA